MFSFKALISENELKYLIQLNDIGEGNVEFINACDGDIKNLIKSVEFEEAPESSLVVKQSVIKRESGPLFRWKDAVAVLTKDK